MSKKLSPTPAADHIHETVVQIECERNYLQQVKENLILQAQIWAGEAKCHQSTVDEVGKQLGGVPNYGPIIDVVNLKLKTLDELLDLVDNVYHSPEQLWNEWLFKRDGIVRRYREGMVAFKEQLVDLGVKDFEEELVPVHGAGHTEMLSGYSLEQAVVVRALNGKIIKDCPINKPVGRSTVLATAATFAMEADPGETVYFREVDNPDWHTIEIGQVAESSI